MKGLTRLVTTIPEEKPSAEAEGRKQAGSQVSPKP